MNTIVCYQCDEEGYLIGETLAYESPREPGVFHYPFLAVPTPPPRPALAGRSWRWLSHEWQEIPDSIRPRRIESPPEPPTLDHVAKLLGMDAAALAALIQQANSQPVPIAVDPVVEPEPEPELERNPLPETDTPPEPDAEEVAGDSDQNDDLPPEDEAPAEIAP